VVAGGAFPEKHDSTVAGDSHYVQSGLGLVDNQPAWFDLPTSAGLAKMYDRMDLNLSDVEGVVSSLNQWQPSLYPKLAGTELKMAGRLSGIVRTGLGMTRLYTDVMPLEVVQQCDDQCENDCGGRCGKTCDGEHLTTIGRGPSVRELAALRLYVREASTG
jgi:hypothetical protein